MRRYRAPLRGEGTSIVDLYWAGCVINISGFDLRQAQDAFCAARSWVDCITNMLGFDFRQAQSCQGSFIEAAQRPGRSAFPTGTVPEAGNHRAAACLRSCFGPMFIDFGLKCVEASRTLCETAPARAETLFNFNFVADFAHPFVFEI